MKWLITIGVNGAKSGRERLSGRLPFLPALEMDKQLNAGTQSVKDKMVSAIKIAGQIERESQKLNQALLEKNNLSFDEKKAGGIASAKTQRFERPGERHPERKSKKSYITAGKTSSRTKNLSAKQQQMEQLLKNVIDPKDRGNAAKAQGDAGPGTKRGF